MINAREARKQTAKRMQRYIENEINEAIMYGNSTTKVISKIEDLQFLIELGYKVEAISRNYCKISW